MLPFCNIVRQLVDSASFLSNSRNGPSILRYDRYNQSHPTGTAGFCIRQAFVFPVEIFAHDAGKSISLGTPNCRAVGPLLRSYPDNPARWAGLGK